MENFLNWIDDVKIINPWILWGGIAVILIIAVVSCLYEDEDLD